MPTAAYHNPQENLHASTHHTDAGKCTHYDRHRPEKTILYQLVQEHVEIIPGNKKNKSNVSDTNDDVPHPPASVRISWTRLLKRVFDIDIERCPHCGGTLKIIAAILEFGAITKILDHLGLSSRAPPPSPAQVFDPFGSV